MQCCEFLRNCTITSSVIHPEEVFAFCKLAWYLRPIFVKWTSAFSSCCVIIVWSLWLWYIMKQWCVHSHLSSYSMLLANLENRTFFQMEIPVTTICVKQIYTKPFLVCLSANVHETGKKNSINLCWRRDQSHIQRPQYHRGLEMGSSDLTLAVGKPHS